MSGDCEIVPYSEDLRDGILELQRHHWGADLGRNLAYLEWKYRENPYLEGPLIHVALERGRPVAMRGMWGARFEAGSSGWAATLPCAGDVVVAPGHRGRGLFASLTRTAEAALAERGFPIALNGSASPVTYVSSRAIGWRSIGPLGRVARQPRPPLRLRGWLRAARRLPAPLTRGDAPRAEDMAALVARLGHDGRIRHVRDAAYLAWRYRNPFSCYVFWFWDEDRLEGYLVLRHDPGDSQRVHLVDWEASRPEIHAALLEAALREFGASACVEAWREALPRDARGRLARAGFAPDSGAGAVERARPTMLIQRLGDAAGAPGAWTLARLPLLARESWDLRMVYSDGV